MRRITSTLDLRDLEGARADGDAYIDALFDFEHITGGERDRLQKEFRALRDETDETLKKRAIILREAGAARPDALSI